MTYGPDNIASIKAQGKFEDYLQMERDLVQSLKTARLVEVAENGGGRMKIAHIDGSYGYGPRVGRKDEPDMVIESAAYSWFPVGERIDHGWSKEWSNFPTINAAKQYARAALKNHLEAVAERILRDAQERLASLEAAV